MYLTLFGCCKPVPEDTVIGWLTHGYEAECEYGMPTVVDLRQCWDRYRDMILPKFIEENPFDRPWAWFQFESGGYYHLSRADKRTKRGFLTWAKLLTDREKDKGNKEQEKPVTRQGRPLTQVEREFYCVK